MKTVRGFGLAMVIAAGGMIGMTLAEDAGKPDGDPAVRRHLDGLEYRYDLTPARDFRLIFETEDGRTQAVFVNSNTETVAGMKVREVWSLAHYSPTELEPEQLRSLLEESETLKIGAWSVFRAEGKEIAKFTAKVPADIGQDDLKIVLSVVSGFADRMEKNLDGADDL